MSSLVEKFVEEPSRAVFNVLTKDQLIQLADHYKIEIPSTHLYKTVKSALCEISLIEASDYASEEDDKEPPVWDEEENPLSPTPAGSLTFAEQKELLRIQLENGKLLHQMQLDRLRLSEEKERACRELEKQKLVE